MNQPAYVNGTTDPEVGTRAAAFLVRYAALYPFHRSGARFLPKPSLDFPTACELVQVWPNDRLEQMAIVFLTTDHAFAASGSRTIRQFAALASWADSELIQRELAVNYENYYRWVCPHTPPCGHRIACGIVSARAR